MDLIRAAWKEMHLGCEYGHSKGRECNVWRIVHHPSAMWLPIANAKGSRMDMAFDGAVPLFVNRRIILDFLNGLVNVPKANNVLEKMLWRTFRCNEFTALLRVCTLWQAPRVSK